MIKKIKMTKRGKFELSWFILTLIMIFACPPIGHISTMAFAAYNMIKILPHLKTIIRKYLTWMNTDDYEDYEEEG